MNIYKIEIGYYSEESVDERAYETTFLTHKEVYTKEEFSKICNQAQEICKNNFEDICLYDMVHVLTSKYGFDKIKTTAEWEL